MPNRLWHQAADRGRVRERLAAARTGAGAEPSAWISWRAARRTVTILSCLLPLVAVGIAAPAAQAEETSVIESNYDLREALEQIKGGIHEDGGSLDGYAKYLSEHTSDTEDAINLDRYLGEMLAVDKEYGADGGLSGVMSRLGISEDSSMKDMLEEEFEHTGETNSEIAEKMGENVDSDVEAAGSATQDVAGGEFGDLAVSSGAVDGVVGATLGALAPLFTLGALTYLDIKNGTNPLSETLANILGTQETEPIEPVEHGIKGHAIIPIGGVWRYVGQCSKGQLYTCLNEQHHAEVEKWEHGFPEPWGGYYGNYEGEPYGYNPKSIAYDVKEWNHLPGAYVLGYHTETNKYYFGSSFPEETVEGSIIPIYNLSSKCGGEGAKTQSFYGWNVIDGQPWQTAETDDHLELNGEEWSCEWYTEGPHKEDIRNTNKGKNGFGYIYRSGAQMKSGFANPGKKSEIEGKGATVIPATGTPVTGSKALESALNAQTESLQRGEDKKAEHLVDHAEKIAVKGTLPPEPGTIPYCRTLTVSFCEKVAEEAGFRKFTVSPLEWATANLEVETEDVVKTEPAEGTEVETGKTITIKPNPEAVSANKLGEDLQTNNAKAELTKEEAKRIAESCLKDTAQAEDISDGEKECETLPIFASGNDVPTATEHDLIALAEYPKWVLLNYESSEAKETKGEKREWYNGLGGCSTERPEGDSCDEYPFYATKQGGPSDTPTPSLKWINASDNSKQGGKYGNFVTSCKMAERSSTAYAFLAIPLLPVFKMPTVYLCN
jgi:hypothetical protein